MLGGIKGSLQNEPFLFFIRQSVLVQHHPIFFKKAKVHRLPRDWAVIFEKKKKDIVGSLRGSVFLENTLRFTDRFMSSQRSNSGGENFLKKVG